MKKYLFLAVAMFLVSVISLMSEEIRLGEKTPCDENLSWEGPRYMVMEKDGCYYLIEYYVYVRKNSRNYTQITGFFSLSEGSECDVYDSFREDAYPYLWLNDPDLKDNLYVEWVVEESPCFEVQYQREEDPIDLIIPLDLIGAVGSLPPEVNYSEKPNGDLVISNIGYTLPCSGDICCYMEYIPTLRNGKIYSWEWLPNPYVQPDCENPLICEPTCDKLKFNWYDDNGGSGYNTDVFDDFSDDILYPNPSTNNFNFVINSKLNGEGMIIVYNTTGKKVLEKSFLKNTVSKEVQINMEKYESGNYFYLIKINSKTIRKGLLSLIK